MCFDRVHIHRYIHSHKLAHMPTKQEPPKVTLEHRTQRLQGRLGQGLCIISLPYFTYFLLYISAIMRFAKMTDCLQSQTRGKKN